MSTQAPEPPVRFYKGIALSFLFLTIILLGVVIFITSKKVTITVLTKQDPEPITFTVTAGTEQGERAIGGKVYTSAFSYSANFTPTGNSQIEDVATGKVTVYNKMAVAQTLVKTTRLVNAEGVLFRLTNQIVIPANGEVQADVYADKKGSISNIGPSKFTIPGLTPDKQKVIYAESFLPMSGGMKSIGSLSADDIDNAKNEYRQKMQAEFIKTLPEAETGVVRLLSLVDENILSDRSTGETVSSFKVYGTSTVVIVEFKKDNLTALVNNETAGQIDSKSEWYSSLTSDPKVIVSTYNANEGTATLNVRQEVAVSLDSNSELLSPDKFFGKKKEEIERYIMGLKHVAGVDVKFSPVWVSTAPAASDRITIILRNIK
ncbi:MAG: hypothetical protein WC725_02730 [Patescibacteria group bacterium]|jgi:hypothetical protein